VKEISCQADETLVTTTQFVHVETQTEYVLKNTLYIQYNFIS